MSRIKTKWIDDNAVNDVKMRLRNNMAMRARNAGDTADIDLFKLSNADIMEILREMSMTGNKITNLADPTAEQDAATKKYVDSVVSGLTDPKDSVKVATTAALPASTYNNGVGTGEGATITGDVNGALPSIDGIGLAVGERILIKNQVSSLENGIYVITALGDAGNPFVLTRSSDANIGSADGAADAPNLVSQGMFCLAAQGTVNGGIGFILTTPDDITLGTTALSFAQFGETVVAGQGISKTGSTISVDAGDGLTFSGNQLVVAVDNDLVDGTTKIDSGAVVGRRRFEEEKTLNGTDVTNEYVDLAKVASRNSVSLDPRFGLKQKIVADYTVSYTGGAGGKTRITFVGDLLGLIEAGDIFDINYESLDY
jgi:hypothetical protein